MSEITVTIKAAGDKKHETKVLTTSTVLQLKEQLAKEMDVSVERQRLIYSGKILKDGDTLETYKIKDGHTIHLVKGAAKHSSSTGPSSTNSETQQKTTGEVPRNLTAGQNAFDPLAGLTSARYAGYNIPLPTLEDMGLNSDGQQMFDEQQLERMMENPAFQESMRNMLSDPQMIDYMTQQSPSLRAMGPMAREMLQSDYVRNMLTNPQMLRSMLQMQRMMNGASGNAGARNASGFPAPGNASGSNSTTANAGASQTSTNNNSSANTASAAGASTSTSNTTNTANPALNPFAALFGAANGATNSASNPASTASGDNANNQGVPSNPFSNPDMWNLLGAMTRGSNQATQAPPVDNRPPEEVYQTQLRHLNDMGFFDFDKNVKALRRSGGSVQGAIEELLNGSV